MVDFLLVGNGVFDLCCLLGAPSRKCFFSSFFLPTLAMIVLKWQVIWRSACSRKRMPTADSSVDTQTDTESVGLVSVIVMKCRIWRDLQYHYTDICGGQRERHQVRARRRFFEHRTTVGRRAGAAVCRQGWIKKRGCQSWEITSTLSPRHWRV